MKFGVARLERDSVTLLFISSDNSTETWLSFTIDEAESLCEQLKGVREAAERVPEGP